MHDLDFESFSELMKSSDKNLEEHWEVSKFRSGISGAICAEAGNDPDAAIQYRPW